MGSQYQPVTETVVRPGVVTRNRYPDCFTRFAGLGASEILAVPPVEISTSSPTLTLTVGTAGTPAVTAQESNGNVPRGVVARISQEPHVVRLGPLNVGVKVGLGKRMATRGGRE